MIAIAAFVISAGLSGLAGSIKALVFQSATLSDVHWHRSGTVVLDMVYDPLETRFLREAQAAGCRIIDGLEMLLAQAMAQFETWTGLEAPVEAMRSAALFVAQEQER